MPIVTTTIQTPPRAEQYRPYARAQTFSISGRRAGDAAYAITVLAGYAAPNITAGWAKINVIDRPLRLGFTVPNGYDPWTMDLPIQFEAVVRQAHGQHQPLSSDIEADIQVLEWMAGRGILYGEPTHGAAGPATALPPLVNVASLDGQGNSTDLIPRNLRLTDWVITNIAYDDSVGMSSSSGGTQSSGGVIRDRSGSRIRQAATVSLMQYVAAPGAIVSPGARQSRRNTAIGAKTVHASLAYNTIEKIVQHNTGGSATNSDIQTVARYNHIRSARQPLKLGQKILIPGVVLTPR